MAYKRNVEIFEEAYEKKDAKSVVSYVARDGRRRYIAGNKNPDGGSNMPSGGGMEEVTWQELKDKRDNGELVAGSLYRITDYNCTTTQENTQSAGHQFDIVLLALSENKLAEEGWAMEHPTDVYDVTFTDGVKKCYLYLIGEEDGYLVDCETLLGNGVNTGDFDEFDADAKTITIDGLSEILNTPDLPYNYFQNSNLSAWKVWYCLDNDKSRFAWADDSVDEDSPALLFVNDKGQKELIRDAQGDTRIGNVPYYMWRTFDNQIIRYTRTQTPTTSDTLYSIGGGEATALAATILGFTPAHEGRTIPSSVETIENDKTVVWKRNKSIDGRYFIGQHRYDFFGWTNSGTNILTRNEVPSINDDTYSINTGIEAVPRNILVSKYNQMVPYYLSRGVIYRLIDEWGNDCPYDFKNIVIYLGGKIEKGYLFSSNYGDIFGDMSLTGVFDDITVKKTIDDNNCQVIDMGILVTDVTDVTERCNIIVAGGALSEDGVNTLSSNVIFGYTMV